MKTSGIIRLIDQPIFPKRSGHFQQMQGVSAFRASERQLINTSLDITPCFATSGMLTEHKNDAPQTHSKLCHQR
jgi:hypothetical protein